MVICYRGTGNRGSASEHLLVFCLETQSQTPTPPARLPSGQQCDTQLTHCVPPLSPPSVTTPERQDRARGLGTSQTPSGWPWQSSGALSRLVPPGMRAPHLGSECRALLSLDKYLLSAKSLLSHALDPYNPDRSPRSIDVIVEGQQMRGGT